jgi:hypothetical protein
VLSAISRRYSSPEGRSPTCYSPVRHSLPSYEDRTYDLHVLGTPPAFILSQDQTRHPNYAAPPLRSSRSFAGEKSSVLSNPGHVYSTRARFANVLSLGFPVRDARQTPLDRVVFAPPVAV